MDKLKEAIDKVNIKNEATSVGVFVLKLLKAAKHPDLPKGAIKDLKDAKDLAAVMKIYQEEYPGDKLTKLGKVLVTILKDI